MIDISKVTQMSGEDGNSIILSSHVELTEEDAQDYIELDELLRNKEYKDDTNLQRVLQSIMSDYQWFYVNNVLITSNWSTLIDILEEVRGVVHGYKGYKSHRKSAKLVLVNKIINLRRGYVLNNEVL